MDFGQCVSPSVRVSVSKFRSVGVSLSGCVSTEQRVGPSGCGGQYACRNVHKSSLKKNLFVCLHLREGRKGEFRERVRETE